jgi:hypothetical protein
LFIALALTLSTAASSTYAAQGFMGKPRFFQFHNRSHVSPGTSVKPAASSLTTWTSSFTYGGTSYSYTMVGTNPASGSATTTTPVVIVPLKLTISGTVFDGSKKVSNVTSSPLFNNANYISGTSTQYTDAIQRAEFWNSVSSVSPNYHVLLGTPTTASTVSVTVPRADGSTQRDSSTGKTLGLVEVNWLDSYLQNHLLSSYSAGVLPIFLSNNVYAYDTSVSNCCIGGYHNASGNNTYAWSTDTDSGVQSGYANDVGALSHELAEWVNDPYVNNAVPSWSVPSEPQYGCSSDLEVGDPLVGVNFSVSGFSSYHLQDEAFFSWFARQSPSIGINGQYTYTKAFTSYSPSC